MFFVVGGLSWIPKGKLATHAATYVAILYRRPDIIDFLNGMPPPILIGIISNDTVNQTCNTAMAKDNHACPRLVLVHCHISKGKTDLYLKDLTTAF